MFVSKGQREMCLFTPEDPWDIGSSQPVQLLLGASSIQLSVMRVSPHRDALHW